MPFYHLPDDHPTLKIVGMDPGVTTFGLCLLTVSIPDLQVLSVQAQTLRLDKISWTHTNMLIHGFRLAKIMALQRLLTEYYHNVQPDVIATESPYINPQRPDAYGALMEVMTHVRMAVVHYDRCMTLQKVTPSQVKNAVGAKGGSDKISVQEGITQVEELKNKFLPAVEGLDEHSIDASAVAYYVVKALRAREMHALPYL